MKAGLYLKIAERNARKAKKAFEYNHDRPGVTEEERKNLLNNMEYSNFIFEMLQEKFRCFITYEEPFAGRKFTYKQMQEVYRDGVDKNEYPDFESWLNDMLKSGVFEEENLRGEQNE